MELTHRSFSSDSNPRLWTTSHCSWTSIDEPNLLNSVFRVPAVYHVLGRSSTLEVSLHFHPWPFHSSCQEILVFGSESQLPGKQHHLNSVAIRETLSWDVSAKGAWSASEHWLACKLAGVSGQHFVYQCTLIHFNRFIVAAVPLDLIINMDDVDVSRIFAPMHLVSQSPLYVMCCCKHRQQRCSEMYWAK